MESDISCILQQLCTVNTRGEAAGTLLEMLEACVILSASNKPSNSKGTESLSDLLASGLPLSHAVEALGKAFYSPVSQQQMQVMCEGMKLCVELAHLYMLPWPLRLLSKLAEADQWLPFLVVVQAFKFPKAKVLKVAELFSNVALREHMVLALTHICYYIEGMERPGSSVRSKRSTLYAKIGIRSREGSPTPGCSRDERCHSSSHSDIDVSVVDDALSYTTSETTVDVGVDAWLAQCPGDLFSVLLTCHQQDNTVSELITAAVTFSLPVLAVFAACYDKYDPGLCLSVWLYTQLPQETKFILHKKLLCEDNYSPGTTASEGERSLTPTTRRNCCRACDVTLLNAGIREKRLIILAHVANGSPEVVSEGLKVFDQHSPLYYLMLAIHEARMACSLECITQMLGKCASAMHREPEVDQPLTSVDNQWLATIVHDIIGTALDECIPSGHQQCTFISALSTVGQLPLFCSHSVNWSLVRHMCEVMGQVKHKIGYRNLLWSFEAGELKNVAWKITEELRDRRCFSEALQICQLVNLPVYTIVCDQLRAEFENSKASIRSSCCNLKKFLLRSHELLCEKVVPPKHGCAFFTAMSEEVPLCAMQYLCLQYALVWHYKTLGNTAPYDPSALHSNAQSSTQFPLPPNLHDLHLSPSYGLHSPHTPDIHSPSPYCPHNSYLVPSHDPHSPPSHLNQTPLFETTKSQFTESSKSFITKLEQRMWEAYVHSYCGKEMERTSLSVTLPEVLGNWPWEEMNGSSCLDVNQVLTKACLTHAFLNLSPCEVGDAAPSDSKESRTAWRSYCSTTRDKIMASRQSRDETLSKQTTIFDEGDCSKKEEEGNRCLVIQEFVNILVEEGMLVTACRVLSTFGEKNKVSAQTNFTM